MVDGLTAAVAGVSSALRIAKHIFEINAELQKSDLKLKMAEVIAALSDAKVALSEAKSELYEKSQEIERLRNSSIRIDGLTKQGELFYDGEVLKANAKCPRCVEHDRRVISIVEDVEFGGHRLKCHACGSVYKNPFHQNSSDFGHGRVIQDYDPLEGI
ncbi:hypothetical protein H1W37_10015 [Stappia taiwanensis]|uniref:Uncharacterized protein n=1 Tax=Stappia taiwanensis TaxID=992267 RepID=A0A838XTK7_9HYPH|nr:hypothetical protein [Stappia taiwanensis]MBA4611988.1 hypothetical protein [Stappia taiwanensis]GGE92012.1 hypothetical protein GCM10007285_19520 [Stappia taiwanensis]